MPGPFDGCGGVHQGAVDAKQDFLDVQHQTSDLDGTYVYLAAKQTRWRQLSSPLLVGNVALVVVDRVAGKPGATQTFTSARVAC